MRIFVGIKEGDSDALGLIDSLAIHNVNAVVWPKWRGERVAELSLFPADLGRPEDVYLHYSGYQKIGSKLINLLPDRCINLHPAPPWYRGSGGLNWAIRVSIALIALKISALPISV